MIAATSPRIQVSQARLPTGGVRFHALDNLRAAMMLMGLLLHAGLSYSHMPRSPIWPFKDARASILCDAIMAASGLFRMPAFFLVAGFFAALIHERRGSQGLLADRCRRILLPFVAGWLVTFPLVRAGFLYAEAMVAHHAAPGASAARALIVTGPYADPNPIHLWFLEYLLIYYLLALPAVRWVTRLRETTRARFSARFCGMMQSGVAPLGLAVVTALPLLVAPMGLIPAPLSFVPEPVPLVAYGGFFAVGWMLFRHVHLFPVIGRHAPRRLALGLLLVPLSGLLLWLRSLVIAPEAFGALPPGAEASLASDQTLRLGLPRHFTWPIGLTVQGCLAMTGALVIWLLVLGVLGLFLRGLNRPHRGLRYLADASYWLYLVHFPLMVWTPILLAPLPAPAPVKFALVLGITTSLMLAGYELLVRPTHLSAFVGSRPPRC